MANPNAQFAGACLSARMAMRTVPTDACASCGCPLAEIGPAFAQHYYTTFDTNRANLQTLYKDGSLLTFENEQFMGMQAIMTKLTVPHRISPHTLPARTLCLIACVHPVPDRASSDSAICRRSNSKLSYTRPPHATRSLPRAEAFLFWSPATWRYAPDRPTPLQRATRTP